MTAFLPLDTSGTAAALAHDATYVPQPPSLEEAATTAQLDYERAKGRLDELNAVAEHLPARVLIDRRLLALDRVRETQGHWRAAREEVRLARLETGFPATDAFPLTEPVLRPVSVPAGRFACRLSELTTKATEAAQATTCEGRYNDNR